MPQTRFVLKKALALDKKVVVVINKIDRPAARPDWVIDATFELFMDLGASDEQVCETHTHTHIRACAQTSRQRHMWTYRRGHTGRQTEPHARRGSCIGDLLAVRTYMAVDCVTNVCVCVSLSHIAV